MLLPALNWKWMLSETTGAAVEKYFIPLSSHIHCGQISECSRQIFISRLRHWGVFVCLFLNSAGLNMVSEIRSQWKQQQQQQLVLLQQPEKVMRQTKSTIKKILQWARDKLRAGIKQTELVAVKYAPNVKYIKICCIITLQFNFGLIIWNWA